MTAAARKNQYSKEDLLACARTEMFGPGNAQLPLPNMLMLDRILEINDHGGKYGKGDIIAERFFPRLERRPGARPCAGLR